MRLNSEKIISQISQAFPDLTWSEVQLRDHGYDHFAVIFDDSLVFRLPKTEVEFGYFDDEIALLKLLHNRTSARTPEITHVSADRKIVGCWFFVGDELSADAIKELGNEKRATVIRHIATFLSELHRVDPIELGDIPSSRRSKDGELAWLSTGYRRYLCHRLTHIERKAIEEYFAEMESCMSSTKACVLLHADLGLDHILLDKTDTTISVIDFSDWTLGDPAFDFCGLFDSPGLAESVYAAYEHKEATAGLLQRAMFYRKRFPIYGMIDSLQGYHCDFDKEYQLFREAFFT